MPATQPRIGLPDPASIIGETEFTPRREATAMAAAAGSRGAGLPARYRIITTNELDAYEAPLMAAEAEIFGLNRDNWSFQSWWGWGGLKGVRRRRQAPGSHVAGVAPDACRYHGTATRGRPPGDAGQMGGRDRAVHPATGTAHGRGTHRGRVAGRRWARHAGVPGPDAAPGLAGVPLDARARSVPASGLGCRAVRHRPARGPWGTVFRHHRRHARAPCIGQGAGSGRALRPCPQAEPSRLPAVPGLCHAGHRCGLSRSAALRADRHRPVPRSWPRREDRAGQGLAAGRGRSPRTAVPAAGRLVYARLADPGGPAAR